MRERALKLIFRLMILLLALGAEGICTGFAPEETEKPAINSTGELIENEKQSIVLINAKTTLEVPTYITNIDGMWFIVDSYHNQIIYNDRRSLNLMDWNILTNEVDKPHSIAGDGVVLLVDDTENHRVLVFEKREDRYVKTQIFNNVGNRPHHTIYDPADNAFYVWSSMTGEMYVFKRKEGTALVYLADIRTVTAAEDETESALNGTYIRSFYIDGDDLYFVSGIRKDATATGIVICDKHTFRIKEVIEVPDKIAGMISLRKDGGYYYMTISTDVHYDQSAATMIRTEDLHGLMSGDYEDIYSKYFFGGGTPYNMTKVGDTLYLTENRLTDLYIWSYKVDENDAITDVTCLY